MNLLRSATLLGALLRAVVAQLAERLNVGLVPEKALVAPVRSAVVGDEQRCVGLDAAAARPLAPIGVTGEDAQTQRVPPRRLVPLPPRAGLCPPAIAAFECGKPGRQ